MKSLSALVPLVLAEIPHSKERENIFLQKIPHRACVGVCGNSSVSETYFVSRVPTHTSTWNQGIDVEDFGILNTKLRARTVRGQRNSSYHPSRLPGIFRLILESYKLI